MTADKIDDNIDRLIGLHDPYGYIIDPGGGLSSIMDLKKLLSKRELEVGILVASGLSNDKIGEKMNISPHTVKTHLRNIYSKTDIKSRTELVVKMLKK